MTKRNITAFILIIASLICLYPGVTLPVLQIKVSAEIPILGALQFYDETQSIIQSITALFKHNNHLVAVLILLFSILIPLIKACLLLLVLAVKNLPNRHGLHQFVNIISKWSMADVFVVSVFMAFLATQSNSHIEAILHTGFYYFLAYCLLSIVAAQLMNSKPTNH